jgi:dienelactone hydrolase
LHAHLAEKPAAKDLGYVQIDIYGRGNNAYRWAGEMDVQEALDSFITTERALGRGKLLDPDRFVLRGFSMGGAGSWHLGLHRPDRWCVIGPGAGFTTTKGYVKNLPDKLPPYEDKCLHIYDAVDYAENASNVPVVAYAGAEDDQLQAAKNIESKLKPLNIPMTLLIAPGLKHQFPPEWQKKAEEEYAKHVAKGRPEYPAHVHFVTYTMKYPSCYWVEILGLVGHYKRSMVDAKQVEKGYVIKTENVSALHIALPGSATREQITISINGQDLLVRPYTYAGGLHVYLEEDEEWSVVLPERLATGRLRNVKKIPGLTGPIDDAFMGPFLCVRGTGKAWHEKTQEFANANLERFQAEWSKYLRGDILVKDDDSVTAEDIAAYNLILFGDPSSNGLIKQVMPDLPLIWSEKDFVIAGKRYGAGDHVPVLIYPSPLNAGRYVVLNSGHTFHAADFQGTNALLYPRLGDYAVLKPNPTKNDKLANEVVDAGLFDDAWRVDGHK